MDTNYTEIVDQCKGCENIHKCGYHCAAFAHPYAQWRSKQCSRATHIKTEVQIAKDKKRVGQAKHGKQTKLSKKQQATYGKLT